MKLRPGNLVATCAAVFIRAATERASSIGTVADLAIFKVASTNSLEEGQQMQSSFTLSNGGPSLLPSAVTVTARLPTGFQYVTSTGNGSYNVASGQWTVMPWASGNTNLLIIRVQVITAGLYTSTATAVSNGLFPVTLDFGANS
jgi:Domain of unknown function DUF11